MAITETRDLRFHAGMEEHTVTMRRTHRMAVSAIDECDLETHGFETNGWVGNPSDDPDWREVYLDRDSAVSAFEKARDSQVKRGFRVVFSQGMENSHAH